MCVKTPYCHTSQRYWKTEAVKGLLQRFKKLKDTL